MATDYKAFRKVVQAYYLQHGRTDLPWRQPEPDGSFDPYRILVSEVMLQQTQVSRVIPKFEAFLERFPTRRSLAQAPLGNVLIAWQGLGYNRRAKFLWQAARFLETDYGQTFPRQQAELEALPGIGRNTASAILVYTFNQPAVFIETNIRTVFLYHFFPAAHAITDTAIAPLVAATLPSDDPRVWYWALMDYGSYLKQAVGNISRASRGYVKQSKFVGSSRQLRGQILRQLAAAPLPKVELLQRLADGRAQRVLHDLEAEGMVRLRERVYELP